MDEILQNPEYEMLLKHLKEQIERSRIKAALAVSRELVELYWCIGKRIVLAQQEQSWGKAVVEHLALDLKDAYPDTTGFSPRSLWRMRAFYLHYIQINEKLAQLVPEFEKLKLNLPIAAFKEADLLNLLGQIPWGHHIVLTERIKDPLLSIWYAGNVITYGWSRNILNWHIDSRLHLREGKATTNFKLTLPEPDSDLAQQVLKDPYNFDFLAMAKGEKERQLENKLMADIEKFLLELGMGFSFVGRQYRMVVDGDEYFIDLLFYHLKLHCYVVIDLKMDAFKPEYAGKMQFYLSAVDDLIRDKSDNPSIGLILCKKRNKARVAYTLKDTRKPIGVAAFLSQDDLPEDVKDSLPRPEQIEWLIEHIDEGENTEEPES